MSEREHDHWIQGVVRARSYTFGVDGKQFLGAVIEPPDGAAWIIDYGEQSPFHALADHKVMASGEPYEPTGQRLMAWRGRYDIGHFRVSTMRPVEVTPDVQVLEIRAEQELSGRFERDRAIPESPLAFVTDDGRTFSVFNDPAGVVFGKCVEVSAYPVQPGPAARRSAREYLWIVCPYSMADLWEWRKRRSGR
jgi:hypothetical protein